MTRYTVHTVPGSPFARAAMLMLEEKGADWQLAPMDPGTLRGPEHLALHPFGRMPALSWDGTVLYETQAILRFLDETLPGPTFTPTTSEGRARMNQLIGICECYLFPESARIIAFQRVVAPLIVPGFQADEAEIAAALPRSATILDELARFLGDADWLGGDRPSLADLLIGPQLELFSHAPEWSELTAELPNLRAWLTRLDARPSMQATAWDRLPERFAKAA